MTRRAGLRTTWLLALGALLALGTMTPPHADAGACARQGLSVDVVAGAGSTFSRGIVVALSPGAGSLGDAPDASGDASSFRIGAELQRGDDTIALTVRPLAPGLALLVPSAHARVGQWSLRAHGARVPVIVRRGAAPAAPTAPVITSMRYTVPSPPVASGTVGTMGGSSGRSPPPPPQPILSLELASPAHDVIAMIAYAVRRETERAVSWAEVSEGARQISFVGTRGGRCTPSMQFHDAPHLGLTVRFAWVDADGRVSERSAPMEVTTGS